ncbi:rCG54955 [Rattus norvegicus]|uniref:RCG54955 n=1 Tax=Rattus norvegicus TaxID=10116 RepID=A6IID8_RAT|nr:rCG54955 [Rattus norvegicus]
MGKLVTSMVSLTPGKEAPYHLCKSHGGQQLRKQGKGPENTIHICFQIKPWET